MEVVEYVELDDIHPFVAGNGLCLVRQLGSLNFRNARDADWTKMSKTDYTYTAEDSQLYNLSQFSSSSSDGGIWNFLSPPIAYLVT